MLVTGAVVSSVSHGDKINLNELFNYVLSLKYLENLFQMCTYKKYLAQGKMNLVSMLIIVKKALIWEKVPKQ